MDLDPSQFPEHTRLQGMAAQAEAWLLKQMEQHDLTIYEALYIVHRLNTICLSLMGKRQRPRKRPPQ
jgi:hypothetical protein